MAEAETLFRVKKVGDFESLLAWTGIKINEFEMKGHPSQLTPQHISGCDINAGSESIQHHLPPDLSGHRDKIPKTTSQYPAWWHCHGLFFIPTTDSPPAPRRGHFEGQEKL